MANTYTRIYIHLVFAVKFREALISSSWKHRLCKYISGIIRHKGHKLIAINSMPDHIHIFVGMKPHAALSDLVHDIKKDSTNFVNREIKARGKFSWQEGFGAFSYSHSHIDAVVKYILNQEKHHHRRTFRDEYTAMLKKFNVEYNEAYIFDRFDSK